MSEFFKAELKDRFLEYAFQRDDYFEMELLYNEFLRPNYNLEFAEKLVREIIDYNPRLLDIMSGKGSSMFMLSGTMVTKDFVEEGGFKDIYIAEEEKWDTFLEQLSSTRELTTKEKSSLGKTRKANHKKERKLLFVLIAAVTISFLYTLFSLGKNVFFDEAKAVNAELEKKILELETKAIEEKKLLLKEISSLKLEISKIKSNDTFKELNQSLSRN